MENQSKPTVKKSTAKSTKKTPAKKAAPKKAVKKTEVKKVPAKKVAVKKAEVKKVPAKKVAVKKAAPVKKVPAKKAPAKKAPAKKAAPVKKVAAAPKEVKKVATSNVSIPTVMLAGKKAKVKRPAVVNIDKFGLGLVYTDEPQVSVKTRMGSIKKTIVHLVKDNMEPRLMNGSPKKVLVTPENITIITPAYEEVAVKTPREKRAPRENGEKSAKDFSKYQFEGNLLSKGRLVLAVINKFVADNNPTLVELNAAFPSATIRPYGKNLFVALEEAEKINTDSKRSRFFTKKEDVIKIKGGVKIAVSNQIDGELVKRLLTVTPNHGYAITLVAQEVSAENIVII